MAHALVIYESMFGNTATIAVSVAAGLEEKFSVDCFEVSHAPKEIPADVEVLVVGGPTHAMGMSRPRTRTDATGMGLREWLDGLQSVPSGIVVATFTTKFRHVPGSAAGRAARHMRRMGARTVDSVNFWVTGTRGPLVAGEQERARRWGSALAHKFVRPHLLASLHG